MSIQNDKWIDEMSKGCGMIQPFIDHSVSTSSYGHRVLSYGLSSYGYDIRLSDKDFRVFVMPWRFKVRNLAARLLRLVGLHAISDDVAAPDIDPLKFDSRFLKRLPLLMDRKTGLEYFRVPPHSYWLGVAMEKIEVPDDAIVDCKGKSTYARVAITATPTPAEPGFVGYLTLEGYNGSPAPVRVYARQGIVQLLFKRGEPCQVPYSHRVRSKYQDQLQEVTTARA